MQTITIKGSSRALCGTQNAKRLRKQGLIPGIIYGDKKENIPVTVSEKEITRLYRTKKSTITVIDLIIDDDKKYQVLPKAIDFHPVKDIASHVDFVFVNNDYNKVKVPIIYQGKETSLGVKRGGVFNIIYRKINTLCLTNKIPEVIIANVGQMCLGDKLKVSDLSLPKDCRFLVHDDIIVASIIGRKKSTETEESSSGEAEEDSDSKS